MQQHHPVIPITKDNRDKNDNYDDNDKNYNNDNDNTVNNVGCMWVELKDGNDSTMGLDRLLYSQRQKNPTHCNRQHTNVLTVAYP